MLKRKIVFFLMLAILVFLVPTIANAAETFTTSDGIVATKIVESTDGSIDFKFTKLELLEEKNYVWGISKTSKVEGVESWYELTDYDYTSKSASLCLNSNNNSINEILRTTDVAYFFIKEETQDIEYVVNALKVDLKLPPLKAFRVVDDSTWGKYTITSDNIAAAGSNATYGISKVSFKFEKITDNDLIKNYKLALINNKDLETLDLAGLSEAPKDGWQACNKAMYNPNYVPEESIPKEQGVYYLWLKAKDSSSKTIIGYTIVGIDIDGPKVTAIEVNTPTSGTYKTGQTVKIHVNFDEIITGTSVPTLKIKFGDSAERTVTNGTIKSNYIEYSYNIQDGDKGQLATVSLTGGTIKDAFKNNAILSCPIISGNTIKANVEETVTNNTQNQDKNNTNNNADNNSNDNANTPSTNNNANSANNNSSSTTNKTNTSTTDSKGTPTRLPQTGEQMLIVVVAVGIITLGAYGYIRYRRLRDI